MTFQHLKNFRRVFAAIAVTDSIFIFIVVIIAILFFRHIVYQEEIMLTSIANSEAKFVSDMLSVKYPRYKKELNSIIPEMMKSHISLFTFRNTGDSVIELRDTNKYKFLWSARNGKILTSEILEINTIFDEPIVRAFLFGGSAIMFGFDYRNICVFSTSVPIKNTNLNLVIKIDAKEFLFPYTNLAIKAIIFGTILMILASIFQFYLTSKPLRAELKKAAINLKRTQEDLKVKESIIFALTTLASYRDNVTAAHIYRTRDYAIVLAKTLGLEENFIDILYKVSCLHDMGKVAVPDALLLKEEPLTKEEFEKIKYHTLAAKEILEEIIKKYGLPKEELAMAKNIAFYHHEKWDGSGYPKGLKGNEIPIEARIFAVADVYDALTSKRPYKQAFDHEAAMKIIFSGDERTKPGDFDPNILEALKLKEKEFKRIKEFYDEYPDKASYLGVTEKVPFVMEKE